ncbi:MAG: DUF3574 domain-containing protein [Pseudomonadota bacterium]|nr:DUF3574 domain-containing protein [Pseudomonadota bacterium]
MPMRRHFIALACTLVVLATTGCATARIALQCAPGQDAAIDERLYFGTQRPDGVVSDLEWEAFIDEVIAPAFPAGFTTWPAQGAWRDASGRTTREASHVLAVVHAASETSAPAIATVIAAYKTRFAQEAVLRTSTPTCM